MSNLCSVYATNPLLKGVRTEADLQQIQTFCNFAQNMDYGPMATSSSGEASRPCMCPYGYGYLSNAYQFSAGPKMINYQQSLNAQRMRK